jgi:prevent-host-death family protein
MKNKGLIGLKDLREHTEKYIEKVQKGSSFVVVRRSEPVFKIAPVDAWGDEGMWEQIADFSEIDERGVEAQEILKSIRKLNESNR